MTPRSLSLSLGVAALAVACSAPESGAPASGGSADATAEVAAAAESAVRDAIPLSPTQLAELESTLRKVHSLTTEMQMASEQGQARLVQRELNRFLDGLDQPVPFRQNLERIVEILSESSGDQLSESEQSAVRSEIQAILAELGVDTSGSGSSDDFPSFAPPPPGGPGPGPGPGPGGPGPGPGPRPGPPGPPR